MKATTVCFLIRKRPSFAVLLGFKKLGFGSGKFTGIGGKVEPGETPAQAAIREVMEEIGVLISPEDLRAMGRVTFLFPAKEDWDQEVWIFTAESWSGEPGESDEIKPAWFDRSEIPYPSMWQDARHWLPPILAGKEIDVTITFHQDNEDVASVVDHPRSKRG